LYSWLFEDRYNITIRELFNFLKKPQVKTTGRNFIKNITYLEDFIEISFKSIQDKLYLPCEYNLNDLYQVCAETFDISDWHNYEYGPTQISKDDIVVDAGSAEGLFSLSIVNRCKNIFIIESNKFFLRALEKTFKTFIPRKIELFNTAIGDKDAFAETTGNRINNSVVESIKGDVKVTTLDNLLKDKGRITYIKADLEGWEMKMLIGAKGIISKYKPKMVIAAYHRDNEYKEMISFIRQIVPEYRYQLRGITQYSRRPVLIQLWV